MLEVVGHPHVVNPDRVLRRVAAERGWPVLQWSTQVGLRDRVGLRSRSVHIAVAGVAATATAAAMAVWAWRRRDTGASGWTRRMPLPLGR